MKRRTFLKGTVVTAGAVVIGCGDDDGTDTTGGTTDGTDTGTDTGTDDGLEDGTAYFPQSVASGDPTPATVILWTRVWDADDTGDLALELQVSIDEAFAELVPLSDAAANLTAAADDDHCVEDRADLAENALPAFQLDRIDVGFLEESPRVSYRVLVAHLVAHEGHVAHDECVRRGAANGLAVNDALIHRHGDSPIVAVDAHPEGITDEQHIHPSRLSELSRRIVVGS